MNLADAIVFTYPEVNRGMSAVFKNIIDWITLLVDARQTQGKLLAIMQVNGCSQSFTLRQMRTLGQLMHMITIPNQLSLLLVYTAFNTTVI